MTSRRDWQLQQLGITQWSLRRPGALQGEIAISLPEHIRLVMVAETPPSLTEPLIGDILRALAVTPDQVLQLTPERVAMLPQDSRCNSWRLGTEASLPLAGAQVSTPALMNSRPARRLAGRSGNKSAHMNTISTLSTADLTKAWHIEKRATLSRGANRLWPVTGGALSQLSAVGRWRNGSFRHYASGTG